MQESAKHKRELSMREKAECETHGELLSMQRAKHEREG